MAGVSKYIVDNDIIWIPDPGKPWSWTARVKAVADELNKQAEKRGYYLLELYRTSSGDYARGNQLAEARWLGKENGRHKYQLFVGGRRRES